MSLCFEVLPFEFLKLLTETFNIFVSHSQFQSLSRWCSKLNFQHEVESPFDFSSKREKNWFKEQTTKTFNTVNQCWQNKKLLKMSFFLQYPIQEFGQTVGLKKDETANAQILYSTVQNDWCFKKNQIFLFQRSSTIGRLCIEKLLDEK